MAVYKDNATGTWRVIYRFTNWKGERKQTQKRGFATKREAQAWEHEAMLKQGAKLDMTFASFFEVYEADKKQRVKESTWESKSHVIRTKILPYFGNRKIAEIEAKDIIAWQNELMAYQDEKGFCFSAELKHIQKHDYVLTPGRYVGAVEQEDDGEPFAEKMLRLTAQLKEQFAESAVLESEIKKNLKGLGYEF